MNKQIPPAVFYVVIALAFLIVTVILYRQATDPLYHRDPDSQEFLPPGLRRSMAEGAAGQADGQKSPVRASETPNREAEASGDQKPAGK